MRVCILGALLIGWISLALQAGVIGDFSKVKNVPGYIDLNKKSQSFKGPWRDKQYNDGVIVVTPSELISQYMVEGRIDTTKIKRVIKEIEVYLENSRIAYCQAKQGKKGKTQKGCKKGFPSEKRAKKWKKNKINIALKVSIRKFKEAIKLSSIITPSNINSLNAQQFLEAFFDGFEIYQGLVQEDIQRGRWGGMPDGLLRAKSIFKKMEIRSGRNEAVNLLKENAQNGKIFYSPEELAVLKKNGKDISRLDPIDSGFWRKPKVPISEFDTTNYNRMEIPFFKKLLNKKQIESIYNQNEAISVVYEFKEPKTSGESPKFDIKYGKAEFKLKLTTDRHGSHKSLNFVTEAIKLIQGNEVNSEQVVNNLAAALGFTVDATYYKNIVKVFFEDEIYEEKAFDQHYKKFVKILSDRYAKSFNLPSALSTIKVDEKTGRKYIEVKHAQLERKSHRKTDMNVGRFVRKGLGKALKREHRAFAIFLAWIWDADTKDGNDKLKIVPYESYDKTDYKVIFSNSDMGASLGLNHPNFYNYKLVRKVKKDKAGNPTLIKFNYFRIYPLKVMDAVTIDDARWIARLMGQLTPKQIEDSFYSAGFPKLVSKYYAGLMLKKRNQLLSALNMFGDSFMDIKGNKVELKKTWEFTGTIKGYEEFFAKNNLTDPDNKLYDPERDPFPRYWGTGYKMNKGEPQLEVLKLLKLSLMTLAGNAVHTMMLENMSYSNEGFSFRKMKLRGTSLAEACSGNCFFQGATQFGVEGFFPWRFIVDNPNEDSEKPYWIVDMFRYGFFLGKHIEQSFGMEIPTDLALGLGGKFYRIREFIKIRPISSLGEFFKDGGELLKTPALSFKGARKQFVRNIKEGEILITSSYIGMRVEAKIRPLDLAIPLITPAIVFGGDILTAKRVTIEAGKNNIINASWDKLKQKSTDLRLNIFDFLIRIPVFEAQLKSLKNVQRTFSFDMNIKSQSDLLLKNMSATTPKNIPLSFAMEKRTSKLKERSFSTGIPLIYNRSTYRKKIYVDFEDIANNYKAEDYSYIKQKTKTKFVKRFGEYTSDYSVKASVNSDNEIYARVKLNLEYGNVDKKIFRKIVKHYKPMLPDNFIQFDLDSVLQNFGTLSLDLETIISGNGLKNIFSKKMTKFNLCTQYAKVQKLDWSTENCAKLSNIKRARFKTAFRTMDSEDRKFILLWNRYDKAREIFWVALKDIHKVKRKKIHKALGKIVQTLVDTKTFKYQAMKLFISLSGKKNYYRRATMVSKLAAFPGKVEKIVEDVSTQGEYRPEERMLSDNPERAFEIFTDDIHEAVGVFFLNNNYLPASGL